MHVGGGKYPKSHLILTYIEVITSKGYFCKKKVTDRVYLLTHII